MRKALVFFLIICLGLFIASGSLAASKPVDISKLSKEELLELRDRINLALDQLESEDDILYDDKDVTIKWLGFDDKYSSSIKHSLLITNKMNKTVYYQITKVAYNGIQIEPANQISMGIEAGMGYITSTNNCCLVDISSLEPLGVKGIDDIKDIYLEVSFYKDDSWGGKAFKTCKLRFENK